MTRYMFLELRKRIHEIIHDIKLEINEQFSKSTMFC